MTGLIIYLYSQAIGIGISPVLLPLDALVWLTKALLAINCVISPEWQSVQS